MRRSSSGASQVRGSQLQPRRVAQIGSEMERRVQFRDARAEREAIREARCIGEYAGQMVAIGNGVNVRASVLGTRGYEAETRAARARGWTPEQRSADAQHERDLEDAIRSYGAEPTV
jgi:hypothetical protein